MRSAHSNIHVPFKLTVIVAGIHHLVVSSFVSLHQIQNNANNYCNDQNNCREREVTTIIMLASMQISNGTQSYYTYNHTTHIHVRIPATGTVTSMGNGAGDPVVSGGDCVGGGPARARIERIQF